MWGAVRGLAAAGAARRGPAVPHTSVTGITGAAVQGMSAAAPVSAKRGEAEAMWPNPSAGPVGVGSLGRAGKGQAGASGSVAGGSGRAGRGQGGASGGTAVTSSSSNSSSTSSRGKVKAAALVDDEVLLLGAVEMEHASV